MWHVSAICVWSPNRKCVCPKREETKTKKQKQKKLSKMEFGKWIRGFEASIQLYHRYDVKRRIHKVGNTSYVLLNSFQVWIFEHIKHLKVAKTQHWYRAEQSRIGQIHITFCKRIGDNLFNNVDIYSYILS
jgi:hypothetical protein